MEEDERLRDLSATAERFMRTIDEIEAGNALDIDKANEDIIAFFDLASVLYKNPAGEPYEFEINHLRALAEIRLKKKAEELVFRDFKKEGTRVLKAETKTIAPHSAETATRQSPPQAATQRQTAPATAQQTYRPQNTINKKGDSFDMTNLATSNRLGYVLGKDRISKVYFRTENGDIHYVDSEYGLRSALLEKKSGSDRAYHLQMSDIEGRKLTVGQEYRFGTEGFRTGKITEVVIVTEREESEHRGRIGIANEYNKLSSKPTLTTHDNDRLNAMYEQNGYGHTVDRNFTLPEYNSGNKPQQLSNEGYKLHVSVSENDYMKFVEKALPYLSEHKLDFKFVTPTKVEAQNASSAGQEGKLLTIYSNGRIPSMRVAQDMQKLIDENGFRPGPTPPNETKLSGSVTYRYSNFSDQELVNPWNSKERISGDESRAGVKQAGWVRAIGETPKVVTRDDIENGTAKIGDTVVLRHRDEHGNPTIAGEIMTYYPESQKVSLLMFSGPDKGQLKAYSLGELPGKEQGKDYDPRNFGNDTDYYREQERLRQQLNVERLNDARGEFDRRKEVWGSSGLG